MDAGRAPKKLGMKLRAAFSFVACVALSWAVVGCGGGVSHELSGTDAGTGASGDASMATTDAGPVGSGAACSTMGGCGAGQECCASLSTAGASVCVAQGTCMGAAIGCKQASDCTSGQVCCGTYTGAIVTTCSTSCTLGIQLCGSDTECPSGDSCQMYFGYGACLPEKGDGGIAFGMDAGPGRDAGPPDTDSGSGVVDSGVVDSGVVDSGVLDSGVVDSAPEGPDSGTSTEDAGGGADASTD
jgi:hypothetical protein